LRRASEAAANENLGNCEKRTCVRLDKRFAMSHDAAPSMTPAVPTASTSSRRTAAKKPRCEDCFFHQNMLCALEEKSPCPTFRPFHPDGLRPPQQLAFVFRHQRRPDTFQFAPTRV
jgi:hypothetical protein